MNNVYKEPIIQRMNIYNDRKEISKEAREEFKGWNRQGPKHALSCYNTALETWFACKSYQEYKQSLKEKE